MSQMISDMWPVVLSILFAIIWLIRLEAKVLYLESEKTIVNQKLDTMQSKLFEISESLARLEGKLESQHHYD